MGSYIGGFIKGVTVGLISFVLGFAALSVLFPVEQDEPAPPAVVEEAPARELPPLVDDEPAPPSDAVQDSDAGQDDAPAEDPVAAPVTPDAPLADDQAATADDAASAAEDTTTPTPAVPDAPQPADSALGADDDAATAALPSAPEARGAPIAGLSALMRPSDEGDTLPPPVGAPPAVPPADPPADPPAEAEPETPTAGEGTEEQPGDVVEQVIIGRLPSIGAPEPAPGEEADDTPDTADEAETAPDLPAYLRYAAAFQNESILPLMTIMLFDTTGDEAAEAALLALDFPVSIVLDPGDDDAPRRAARYREAGHEIVLLPVGLPAMATASDIEVNFAGWQALLPEVVAIMDTPEEVLRGNLMLARNVLPVLAEDGHGLILQGGGLGGLRQAASGEGVPSARVFRSLDDDDENRHLIRRYLDRAVFEAQQQGRVVVTGRAAHEETLAAIALWQRQGRADQVTLAPVSAVLQVQ